MKSAGMQESIDRMVAEDEFLERFKIKPFKHQIEGIKKLVENDAFFLADEMGVGKSAQVINAACILAEQAKIGTVVVVAPASVRCVWLDTEIGEIRKHAWVCSDVWEFHSKIKQYWSFTNLEGEFASRTHLDWIVTNYEFLRDEDHLAELLAKTVRGKIMLVLDESSYIKNRAAARTQAILRLRKHCARCVLLNGTPVTQSPLDLWSQMQVLDASILGRSFHNYYQFRSEYCEMRSMRFGGRRSFQQVVSYQKLDDLAKRLAPYVLRRLKQDCLDLPPKLYSMREVALSTETWKKYCELRKDCLLHLSADYVQLEPNAAVRVMRLAQLTSGILGGSAQDGSHAQDEGPIQRNGELNQAHDISDEKLRWAVEYLTEECQAKAVIVWCRFRRERERLYEALTKFSEHTKSQLQAGLDRLSVYQLYGGQGKKEREEAVAYFSCPQNMGAKRYALLAQQHAGGHGLNLIAATECVYLSNDFSLGIRLQSEDRAHRPGQKHTVTYIDVIAVGPAGQRTVDRTIFEALREKKDVAALTTAEWRKELEAE